MEYSADQENAAAGSLQRLDGLSVCDVLCGHAVHGHDSVVQPTPQRTLLQLPYTRQQLTYSHIHTFFQDYPRWASTRKVKPIWILLKKRQSEWQWHKLGYMQVCTSLQTDNHTSTSPLKFFTGRMPFLPPTQQRQSTESNSPIHYYQYCDNCNNYDDYNNDDDYSDYYYYFYNHCNCCCCGCYRCCPAALHTVQYTAAAI